LPPVVIQSSGTARTLVGMRRFVKRPSTIVGVCATVAGGVIICVTGITVAARSFDSTPVSPSVSGVELKED
jgi:hypothetical protein